ncbi:hypothetical protein AV530_000955 [Patagioenas fasciata monilis]|uniref:Uncharacterized protein n=1 Tax=Patagioenas fasciata monilis TaxID=372326 RepID=A0A1V4KSS4_PATFA|nr:hypothetical protein AV530_000955 [Patagioenas fasciata monilis]
MIISNSYSPIEGLLVRGAELLPPRNGVHLQDTSDCQQPAEGSENRNIPSLGIGCYYFCTLLCQHFALLQEIKVLVVAHNIPTRLFPDWYVAAAPSPVTPPVTSPQSTAEPQPTAELVAELLGLLLTLAAGVQSSEDDSEDTLESVHTLAPELLIPSETINSLYNAEECASPEDFLRIYLSPSQPTLDSETVWPVPSHPTP